MRTSILNAFGISITVWRKVTYQCGGCRRRRLVWWTCQRYGRAARARSPRPRRTCPSTRTRAPSPRSRSSSPASPPLYTPPATRSGPRSRGLPTDSTSSGGCRADAGHYWPALAQHRSDGVRSSAFHLNIDTISRQFCLCGSLGIIEQAELVRIACFRLSIHKGHVAL